MLEYYHRFMFYFIDNLLSFSFILSKPIYLSLSLLSTLHSVTSFAVPSLLHSAISFLKKKRILTIMNPS